VPHKGVLCLVLLKRYKALMNPFWNHTCIVDYSLVEHGFRNLLDFGFRLPSPFLRLQAVGMMLGKAQQKQESAKKKAIGEARTMKPLLHLVGRGSSVFGALEMNLMISDDWHDVEVMVDHRPIFKTSYIL